MRRIEAALLKKILTVTHLYFLKNLFLPRPTVKGSQIISDELNFAATGLMNHRCDLIQRDKALYHIQAFSLTNHSDQ